MRAGIWLMLDHTLTTEVAEKGSHMVDNKKVVVACGM